MNAIKRNIPNSITCCNLFSGCVACVFAFWGNFDYAAFAVVAAAVFDFFDGFAARGLKAYSPMGKELDSLADDVSFGVAPSVAVYSYLDSCSAVSEYSFVPFLAFFIAVFSALRLAKFNIDERQTSSFIGLPTPANALFWMFIISTLNHYGLKLGVSGVAVLLVVEALFCYLMVSPLPMFSLKFHDFSLSNNKLRYLFLAVSVVFIIIFRMASSPVIILFYIMLSVIDDVAKKKA